MHLGQVDPYIRSSPWAQRFLPSVQASELAERAPSDALEETDQHWPRLLDMAFYACRRAGEVLSRAFASPPRKEVKDDGTPVSAADREAEVVVRDILSQGTPHLGLLGEELGASGPRDARWIIDPLDGTRSFLSGLPHFAVLIALQRQGVVELAVVHAPLLADLQSAAPDSASCSPEQRGATWWAVRGRGAYSGRGTCRLTGRWQRLQTSCRHRLDASRMIHGELDRMVEQAELWRRLQPLLGKVECSRGFPDWWGHMWVAEGRADWMVDPRVLLHDIAPVRLIMEESGGHLLVARGNPLQAGEMGAVLSSNRRLAPRLATWLGARRPA